MSPTVVVVVSHYNAWPTDQLVRLLDQIRSIPAGLPFAVRVVVNQAEDKPLELPERHGDVAVSYRPNVGYNIGAWEHGWRQGPPADFYLFLQEECVIDRPGWLRAFVRVAARRRVGMVGENINYYNSTWDDMHEAALLSEPGDSNCYFVPHIRNFGIDPGTMADHLQSLVLCLRREVLERIGGFPIGRTKYEAIAAEVATSKAVQAIGLQIRQVAVRPFTFIHHSQWDGLRQASKPAIWALRRLVSDRLFLARFQRAKRARSRRARGIPSFDVAFLDPENPRTPGSKAKFDKPGFE